MRNAFASGKNTSYAMRNTGIWWVRDKKKLPQYRGRAGVNLCRAICVVEPDNKLHDQRYGFV